jgi:hypothetical protein
MSRFQRFVLSQIIWMGGLLGGMLIGGVYYSSALLIFMFGVISIIGILLNLFIWFGDGIFKGFQDANYNDDQRLDTPQRPAITEKRKNDSASLRLQDLNDDDLAALRERLRLLDERDELGHLLADDGEMRRTR